MKTKRPFLMSLALALALAACSLPGSGGGTGGEAESTPAATADPAACLVGEWEMSNADLNAMLASRVPVAGMSIPTGTFHLTFDGANFGYGSDLFTLRAVMPGGYMEAEAIFLVNGSYGAADGVLIFSGQVYDSEVMTWRAMIAGTLTEVAGAQTLFLPAPGDGPYTCTAASLSVPATSGNGDTFVMVFSRVR